MAGGRPSPPHAKTMATLAICVQRPATISELSMKNHIAGGLLAIALSLAGCGQLGLDGRFVAPTQPPTLTAIPTTLPLATPVASTTPAPAEPAAGCPTPSEGQALYVSRENGYCFLYPATFSAQSDFLRPAQS